MSTTTHQPKKALGTLLLWDKKQAFKDWATGQGRAGWDCFLDDFPYHDFSPSQHTTTLFTIFSHIAICTNHLIRPNHMSEINRLLLSFGRQPDSYIPLVLVSFPFTSQHLPVKFKSIFFIPKTFQMLMAPICDRSALPPLKQKKENPWGDQ